MMMQSNEPFSRVDQGMSPMTSGLLGGLVAGGVAAGYQGLGYLSYTGLDKKHESGLEKIKGMEEKLATMDPNEVKISKNPIHQINAQRYTRKINTSQAGIDNGTAAIERFQHELDTGTHEVKSRLHGGESVSRRELSQMEGQTGTPERISQVQQRIEKLGSQVEGHQENLTKFQDKRTKVFGKMVSNPHETLRQEIESKRSMFSDSSLAKEKEAHRWHGNSLKSSLMKIGAFELGGFVVGGGIQMAANSFNNG